MHGRRHCDRVDSRAALLPIRRPLPAGPGEPIRDALHRCGHYGRQAGRVHVGSPAPLGCAWSLQVFLPCEPAAPPPSARASAESKPPTPSLTPSLTPAPAPPPRSGPDLSPGGRAARPARLPRHPGRAHLVGVQAPRAPQVLRQAARPALSEAARHDRRLRVVRRRAQVHRPRVQPAAPAREAAHAHRHVRPLRLGLS